MSTYKTRPIGEIFQHNNKVLQVVENDTCEGCYFNNGECCISYTLNEGYCGDKLRDDHKNVIFKRITE